MHSVQNQTFIHKTIIFLMIVFAFVFPISLGVANAVLLLILLLWIIDGDFQRKFSIIKEEKISWIFLIIGFLILISAILSETTLHSFFSNEHKSLIRILARHYILLPIIIPIYITTLKRTHLNYVITTFLLGIFFSEIISYLIFFELIDIEHFKSKHLLNQLTSPTDPSPFLHHTAYSFFLSIASVFLLHQFLHTKKFFFKLLVLTFLITATANLFINGGRTGQISYILAMVTYMLVYVKFDFKLMFSSVVLLVIIVTTAYFSSPNFHKRTNLALENIQQASKGNYKSSWGVRIASTKVALSYLFDSPEHFIKGAGAGESRAVFLKHASEHFGKNISEPIKILAHLHNQYLQYWMDGTLFSVLLFLLYFILLFRLPLPASYKPLLYSFTIAVAFACETDIPMFHYQTAMLVYLMTAYFVLLKRTASHRESA